MRCWLASTSLLALVSLAGCASGPLSQLVRTTSPHEQYHDTLRRSGLDQTALGTEWARVSEAALQAPVAAVLPFHETGYFAPGEASAVAYRFELSRGRQLEVDVAFHTSAPGRLFVDLFRIIAGAAPVRVSSMPADALRLEYRVDEDASYVLRIQPELLRGGRYTVTERTRASLTFPVPGLSARAVQSAFGGERDAGDRTHEGIDIFAPRGTPVVAVAGGVARADTNALGGNVVWLESAGARYYYAHLDAWAIDGTAIVRAGDTLGYVGNTGNARTTPPHLHFGIYAGRAIDPLPFVQPDDVVPVTTEPPSFLGEVARVTTARTPLREGAAADAAVRRELGRGSVVKVIGASQRVLRVELPDRSVGYVAASRVAAADTALRRQRLPAGAVLRELPMPQAPAVEVLEQDTQVEVVGEFDGYTLVRRIGTEGGWIADRRTAN